MRTFSLVALVLATSTAFADPGAGAQKPPAVQQPPRQPQPAAPPRPAPSQPAQPARIAQAVVMADRAIAPLALCDCGESIREVDAAVAPAIAILDNVIEIGDATNQVLAEHAEGKLYLGLVTRLRDTLPRPAPGASDSEVALRDVRKQTLELQLAPWREAAMTAFQHVVDVAKAHPEVARSTAAANAVRDSQRQLAAEVASR